MNAAKHINQVMLKIAAELELPIDAITERLGWLGTSGSGKTYGAGKLAEEMPSAGAQVIVLDPVGPCARPSARGPRRSRARRRRARARQLPLSLDATGASLTTGNCTRWVCTPKGCAFLHVRRELQPKIRRAVIMPG